MGCAIQMAATVARPKEKIRCIRECLQSRYSQTHGTTRLFNLARTEAGRRMQDAGSRDAGSSRLRHAHLPIEAGAAAAHDQNRNASGAVVAAPSLRSCSEICPLFDRAREKALSDSVKGRRGLPTGSPVAGEPAGTDEDNGRERNPHAHSPVRVQSLAGSDVRCCGSHPASAAVARKLRGFGEMSISTTSPLRADFAAMDLPRSARRKRS